MKLLIALATTVALVGPAHAEDRVLFKCGIDTIPVISQHLSDAQVYNLEVMISRRSKKNPRVVTFDVAKQRLTVDGKRCRPVEESD